jgi:microcystin-dependent protein
MDPLLGTIIIWPIAWIPEGWLLCDGTLLNIQQNAALFSLIGTTYGGDGQRTFALPDLRGNVVLGVNNTGTVLGKKGGSATANVTLTANNLPAHTHPATFTASGASAVNVQASTNTTGNTNIPSTANKYLAASPTGNLGASMWSNTLTGAVDLGGVTGGTVTGGTVAVNNNATTNAPISIPTQPPFLALNFIIATMGIYPTRP